MQSKFLKSKEIAKKTNWIKPLLDSFHIHLYKNLLVDLGMGIYLIVGTTIKDLRNHVRVRMIMRPRRDVTKIAAPKPRRLDDDKYRKLIDYGVKLGFIKIKKGYVKSPKKKIVIEINKNLEKMREKFPMFFKYYSNNTLMLAELGLYSINASLYERTQKQYNTDLFYYLFKVILSNLSISQNNGRARIYFENLHNTLIREIEDGKITSLKNIEIVDNYYDAEIVVINNALWTVRNLNDKIKDKLFIIYHTKKESLWGLFNTLCNYGEYEKIEQKNKKIGKLDIIVNDALL